MIANFNNNVMHKVIVVLVFFVSSGVYLLSIPALLMVLLYLLIYGRLFRFSRKSLLIAILYFLSVGFSLFVGLFDQFGESAGYTTYLFLLFYCMIMLVSTAGLFEARSYIYSYLLGSFLFYAVVITYSCWYPGAHQCGYGEVYNFFTNSIDNTPGYANVLAIFPALGLAYVLICNSSRNLVRQLMCVAVILVAILLLSYLSSRASLVLLSSAFVVSLFLRNWISIASSVLILVAVVFSVFLTLDYIMKNDLGDVASFESRLQEKGLETQRWDRYQSGFIELLKTPIGVYRIDPSVGENNLVHNIYLDLAKFGGWLVFFSFFILSLLGFSKSPLKQDESYRLIFVVYFVTLLSLQQDVFYGAGLPVLVVFLMSNTYLYCLKR